MWPLFIDRQRFKVTTCFRKISQKSCTFLPIFSHGESYYVQLCSRCDSKGETKNVNCRLENHTVQKCVVAIWRVQNLISVLPTTEVFTSSSWLSIPTMLNVFRSNKNSFLRISYGHAAENCPPAYYQNVVESSNSLFKWNFLTTILNHSVNNIKYLLIDLLIDWK